MNPRERNILIVTILVVIGALAANFMLGDSDSDKGATDETAEVQVGDVKAAQKAFRLNVSMMKNGPGIRHDYEQIKVGVSEVTKALRPETKLINELYDLLKERLHVPNPRIGTPAWSPIPNVNEYTYVDCSVDISGNYQEVINLLQEMNRLGLLIKTFKISQQNSRQSDQVNLNMTVSRLIKRDDRINRLIAKALARGA